MQFKILPSEVFVTEHGALIRTRCPQEHITEQMIHQRVLASNLACGDVVRVQCINHERNTVLYFAEWLVFDRQAEIQRAEINDRETRTVEVLKFSVFRTVDWTATPAVEVSEDEESAEEERPRRGRPPKQRDEAA